jgi:hypothetical protein
VLFARFVTSCVWRRLREFWTSLAPVRSRAGRCCATLCFCALQWWTLTSFTLRVNISSPRGRGGGASRRRFRSICEECRFVRPSGAVRVVALMPRVALRFTRGYLRMPLRGRLTPDQRRVNARSMPGQCQIKAESTPDQRRIDARSMPKRGRSKSKPMQTRASCVILFRVARPGASRGCVCDSHNDRIVTGQDRPRQAKTGQDRPRHARAKRVGMPHR